MIKKCFIGVDYQLDFMEGGRLPVSGGLACARNCAEFLKNNKFDLILLTCDWHPFNHSSFKEFDGKWPLHCIQHTFGASIHYTLFNNAFSNCETKVLTKGTKIDKEEYSIFQNEEANKYFSENNLNQFDEIHFGGIAGNVCVLNTLKDAISIIEKSKIVVHLDLVASLDEKHKTLVKWCKENDVKVI